MQKLIIIGDGGHSRVVQSIVSKTKEFYVTEIWDDKFKQVNLKNEIVCKKIPENILSKSDTKFFIAIGDNLKRKEIKKKLNIEAEKYAILIDPSAIIDRSVKIKSGSIVMAGAVIQSGVDIGQQSIINTRAVIEHDNKIQNFVHIGPNSTITGNCSVQSYVFLGASSVLLPGITINKNTIVGAGSVVTKSLDANIIAYGNPAKKMKENTLFF